MAPKHIVSATAIVVNERNEILLIKEPKRGWEMPGGQVEEGESLKDAAIRETKEESRIFSNRNSIRHGKLGNFKQRIELCLSEEHQPFMLTFLSFD